MISHLNQIIIKKISKFLVIVGDIFARLFFRTMLMESNATAEQLRRQVNHLKTSMSNNFYLNAVDMNASIYNDLPASPTSVLILEAKADIDRMKRSFYDGLFSIFLKNILLYNVLLFVISLFSSVNENYYCLIHSSSYLFHK